MSVNRVWLTSLGVEVSALGFGCASLGSRIAPSAGLEALERAYDAGVSWFDVAPSYGDGQAEELLGSFLRGRRDRVQVLTKVGIAPPQPSLTARAARPFMRSALAAIPSLRSAIRKRRPAATKLPLSSKTVHSSVDASLRRLGTDHVDVLALHDATIEEAARDDIIASLEAVVAAGKARTVAIASSPAVAVAGAAASRAYGLAQMENNPFNPATTFLGRCSADVVTHSVFGTADGIGRLSMLIKGNVELQSALKVAGYEGNLREVATDYLADYAFTTNQNGVVLVSMFKAHHLISNVSRHSRRRDAAAITNIARLIRGGEQ